MCLFDPQDSINRLLDKVSFKEVGQSLGMAAMDIALCSLPSASAELNPSHLTDLLSAYTICVHANTPALTFSHLHHTGILADQPNLFRDQGLCVLHVGRRAGSGECVPQDVAMSRMFEWHGWGNGGALHVICHMP